MSRRIQPSGTVTFLFTDIEGSTRLLEQVGAERYADLLSLHQKLIRDAVATHGGHEVRTEGDSHFVVFDSAGEAVAATLDAQRALASEAWPAGAAIRVRMGAHTGEAVFADGDYQGQPVHEAARICQAAHGGQVLLSRTTADLASGSLPDGAMLRPLGEHRLKDLSRPTSLVQLVHPDLGDEFPRLRTMDALPNNLPVQLTPFIGRDRELPEVTRLIERTRLLTLTGAGGSGKTRLAVQAAADLLETFPDGVWIAELAPLTDPQLVPRAVAAAVGAREQPGRPIHSAIADAIGARRVLLILDNCEHLLPACADLVIQLIAACPALHVVATTREALAVAGEVIWRVPSLSAPDPRAHEPAEALMRYESVRLFVDRARAAVPTFTLDDASTEALAHICHRLDGIPLALELAAARVRVLSVQQINERLHDRFRLLTGGRRGALPRQRTLRALVDWSYDLLDQAEQTLLRRLSVFAGGFDLEAAESVCVDGALAREDILDLLAALADKSLVNVEDADGRARYRLLETIREFCEEKLGMAEDAEAVRRRHRDHFLSLAEQTEKLLEGPEQPAWLRKLEAEHDNVRAALHWTLSLRDGADAALRMSRSLWRFWFVRGHVGEGRAALEASLRAPGETSSDVRSRALRAAGALALAAHDVAASEAAFEASLAVEREAGNDDGIAIALNNLGLVAQNKGDFDRARTLLEESLEITRRRNIASVTSATLHNLGLIALIQGDTAAARPWLHESLALERARGDLESIARCLANLGSAEAEDGLLGDSRAHLQESLEIRRSLGDRRGIAGSLVGLARVAREEADPQRAREMLIEAAGLAEEIEWHQGVAMVIENLARVAEDEGDPFEALTLLAAAERARRDAGAPLHGAALRQNDELLERLRSRLGARAEAAEQTGAALDPASAVQRSAAPPARAAEPVPAYADEGYPRMIDEGGVWTISYNGRTARVRDSKGMGYLARLLSAPRHEIHVLELAGAPISLDPPTGPQLDDAAKRAYRARLEALEQERDEAQEWGDAEKAERARLEIETLGRELGAAVGLGGRDRAVGDTAERARVNITKAIKTAIQRIREADTGIGDHLARAVRTGVFCVYAPERAGVR